MSSKKKNKQGASRGPIKRWWKSPGVRRVRRRISDAQVIFFPFVRGFTRVWLWTLRKGITYEKRGPLYEYIHDGKPCILTFWHQDAFTFMVDMVIYLRGWPCRAMASPGRVGQLAGYLMGIWGVEAVYGSSSRGGWDAVDELSAALNAQPAGLLIMADGSRGPAREARWGAINIARNTGIPIVPVHGWCEKKVILRKTWMKLPIPLSWGRGIVLSADPIHIPTDTPDEKLEDYREELERKLNEMVEATSRYLEEGDSAIAGWPPPDKLPRPS